MLLILSVLFYKERTVFLDNAYHLFIIIKDGDFAFQNFRYGAVFTQAVPLLASKLNISLNAILISYSVCFVIYYALCYYICGSILKNYRLALVLLVFNIAFVSDTFFWMLSELPQGIAFMLVLLSYLSSRLSEKATLGNILLVILGTIVVIIFFHPLMMFPYLFVLVFFFLNKPAFDKRIFLIALLSFVMAYVLKKTAFTTEYERNATNGAGKLIDNFPHYFRIYANKAFLLSCLTKYYFIPIISFSILFVYLRQKKWAKLTLFCCCAIGYLLMINVTYPGRDVEAFYIENMYLPLGIIIGFPFVFDVLPNIKDQKWTISIFAIIIVVAGLRIVMVAEPYTSRLDWEREFLKKHRSEKILVAESLVPMDLLLMSWGTPYEFWLLSTVEGDRTASIVVNNDVKALEWGTHDARSFLTQWGVFPYKEMPSHYFKFSDTLTNYTTMQ
jgi:hypothetical protein